MGLKHQRFRCLAAVAGFAIFLLFYSCHRFPYGKHRCTFSATLFVNYSNWKLLLAFPSKAHKTLLHASTPFAPKVTEIKKVETKTRRTNVVIIAQGRSGSSFLGQVFNQHPDVFYLYEPLYNLEQVENFDSFQENTTGPYDKLAAKYLRELLNCSFGNERYLEYMSRYGHFRFSSRVLKSPPFCQPSATNAESNTVMSQRLCDLLTKDAMERVCKKHKISVIKLLSHRIPHKRIQFILKKLSSPTYDLVVIHLVRDPRAVINSMWKRGWIAYMETADRNYYAYSSKSREFHLFVQRICNVTRANLKTRINPPSWANAKYKLLRYEDFVQQPQWIAETLYNFTGLVMFPEIRNWIHETTHPTFPSTENLDDPYSIRKDPRLVLDSWKGQLDDYTISVVEKYCASVMKMLDYQPLLVNISKFNSSI